MSAVHPFQSSSAMPSSMLMMGYCETPLLVHVDQLIGGEHAALLDEDVGVLVAKLGRRDVQGDAALLAGTVSGRLDGLHDQVQRSEVGHAAGGGATLVTDGRSESAVSEQSAKGVIDLRSGADRLAEGIEAHRHDHELLEIGGVVCVLSAVQDVEHRYRQTQASVSIKGAVEGDLPARRSRLSKRHGYSQDGVGAQIGLVGCAVHIYEEPVYGLLIVSVESNYCGSDLVVDVADSSQDALAFISCLVIVTELEGLVLARAGAGRHGHASPRAVVEEYVHLDGRVSPGVQDLSAYYLRNLCHDAVPHSPPFSRSICP